MDDSESLRGHRTSLAKEAKGGKEANGVRRHCLLSLTPFCPCGSILPRQRVKSRTSPKCGLQPQRNKLVLQYEQRDHQDVQDGSGGSRRCQSTADSPARVQSILFWRNDGIHGTAPGFCLRAADSPNTVLVAHSGDDRPSPPANQPSPSAVSRPRSGAD